MDTSINETTFHYLNQQERFKIVLESSWLRFRSGWSIFIRNRLAVLGLLLLSIYILMAAMHPILLKTVWTKKIYDPVIGHDLMIFPHPSPPSSAHLLGTDTLGRDVLSLLMAATAPSLIIAFSAAITAAIVGTLVGAVSAFFRGFIDSIFTHLADIMLLAPAPLVMVVIGFMLDIRPLQFGIIYGLLVGIGAVGIVLRSHALSIMNRTFIQAAKVAGGTPIYIVLRHLIPHMLPLAAVNMLLTVTGVIFAAGFIAFLGLSRAQLNWGSMIYDSFTYQTINGIVTWNVLIPSAIAISLFAASFYFIALGLHDVVDPRLAERKEVLLWEEKVYEEVEVLNKRTRAGLAGICEAQIGLDITVMAIKYFNVLAKPDCVMKINDTYYLQELLTQIERLLGYAGGNLERRIDDGILVCFGRNPYIPSRASALVAIELGLNLIKYNQENNNNPMHRGQRHLKIGVGIASGRILDLQDENSSCLGDYYINEITRTARILEYFSGMLISGGMLINERAFINLSAVRHHFCFGRSGLVEIPGFEGKKMVYQVVGRNQ